MYDFLRELKAYEGRDEVVTSKAQLVNPARLRRRFGIKKGTLIASIPRIPPAR